jgi:pyridinium-3,5-biscarboxylic acid mononucleotide sulfurtransferase
MTQIDGELEQAYARLRTILVEMGSVVIAMSGGVDSVLLAMVAQDVLGDRALAITADSPSLPRRELREAIELARLTGIRHLVVPTAEVADPRYAANPTNRCYFCKNTLFARLEDLATEQGITWVAYGENSDDLSDHRPGLLAAGEHHIRAPLKEAGLDKAAIRALARHLGLPVWDKPAFACLGSRFPYGTAITPERLAQVETAEDILWQIGFRQYRVRYHDDLARIEVGSDEMPQMIAHAAEVVDRLRSEAGFRHVTLDLAGYRRGSMNEGHIAMISLHTVSTASA